jgi:transcriptional regulator with XRE-family HTH domain
MKDDPSKKLREQIQIYRKAANISLEELGRRINKSKATVWKYENGLIDMDVNSMFEIAAALNISVSHLIDSLFPDADAQRDHSPADDPARCLFMYSFDGYKRKIGRSAIRVSTRFHEASLFYRLESFDRLDGCRDFYTGNVTTVAPYMNFSFSNVNNDFESLFIVAKEPFKKQRIMKGLLTGISYKVFQPLSFKVLLSEKELAEDSGLETWLKFTKDELSDLRRHNALILSEEYCSFHEK